MERIYLLVVTSSQEPFNPTIIKCDSLDNAIAKFYSWIEERDDETWRVKCVDKQIHTDFDRYSAKLLCNHKGWGYDFIRNVEIISLS